MKIIIIKWEPMSWHWLHKEELENKELDVIKKVAKGKKNFYLIKEPNKYVSSKDCIEIN